MSHPTFTIYLESGHSLFARIVQFFTGALVSHAFIHIGDEVYLEARPTGVEIFDSKTFKKRRIVTAFCPQPSHIFVDRSEILLTALLLKSKHYDFLRSISYLWKRSLGMPEAYNCIEAVKAVLDRCKIPDPIKDNDAPIDILTKLRTDPRWVEITLPKAL